MELHELFLASDQLTNPATGTETTTARGARFRVQYPNSLRRQSRIFALDRGAADAMFSIADEPWNGAHFLSIANTLPVDRERATPGDILLAHSDGKPADLSEEIDGADMVVLLATSNDSEGAADVIGQEALARGIMCVGLAIASGTVGTQTDKVVNSLRRFSSIIVVSRDNDYIPAMLEALRA